jgi:hypothetical protein
LQQVAATPRIIRTRWPRRGQDAAALDNQASESAFLFALARELDVHPIDLLDAGRIREDPLASPAPDDSADRAAFHSQLMPPGFSIRSFANGYAPGKLFSLVG